MRQDALFLAGCALVVLAKLACEAWKRRRLQRALDELARVVEAWDPETGYPKECVAEGLGTRFEPKLMPSPVVPFSDLDESARRAIAEVIWERHA